MAKASELFPCRTLCPSVSKGRGSIVSVASCMCVLIPELGSPAFVHLVSPPHAPGAVKAEMLEMYTQEDLLILCVRLAVLLAVTLTVPVVLFPVSTGREGLGSAGIWMDEQREETWMFGKKMEIGAHG